MKLIGIFGKAGSEYRTIEHDGKVIACLDGLRAVDDEGRVWCQAWPPPPESMAPEQGGRPAFWLLAPGLAHDGTFRRLSEGRIRPW